MRGLFRAPNPLWEPSLCCYNQPSVGKRVSLFVTCLGDQLFPAAGMAVVEVLERLGYTVDFPKEQTCCGQPAFNSGYRNEARTVARQFWHTSSPRLRPVAWRLTLGSARPIATPARAK